VFRVVSDQICRVVGAGVGVWCCSSRTRRVSHVHEEGFLGCWIFVYCERDTGFDNAKEEPGAAYANAKKERELGPIAV